MAKLIDWSVIQAMGMLRAREPEGNPRLEEALDFLKGPDFIPLESQPASLEFNGTSDFRFPTPCPSAIAENNVVYGRLYRCGGQWQKRPVIVLLHGRGDVFNHRYRFPQIARRCNRDRFNVATLEAPYYFRRHPRPPQTLRWPDYLLLARTAAQAVAEIRALTGWLLDQGCPGIAIWGVSYSGWLAGLTVCRDARLSAAVLSIPGGRFYAWLEERTLWPAIRRRLPTKRAEMAALNRTALNLATVQPAISKENVLLIDAIHDLMVPKDATRELWEAWGQPELWRLPHGHVSVICMTTSRQTERVLRWLTPRLENPVTKTPPNKSPHPTAAGSGIDRFYEV